MVVLEPPWEQVSEQALVLGVTEEEGMAEGGGEGREEEKGEVA